MPKPESETHVQEEDIELNIFYEFPTLREIYKNVQVARGDIDPDEEDLGARGGEAFYDEDEDVEDENPSMIPLAFMEVNDLVVRKSNPDVPGVVMVVGWAMDDEDRDEYDDEDVPAVSHKKLVITVHIHTCTYTYIHKCILLFLRFSKNSKPSKL